MADGDDRELSFFSIEHPHLNIRLGEHRVDQEAIAGGHLADAAQVGDDHVAVDTRMVECRFLE